MKVGKLVTLSGLAFLIFTVSDFFSPILGSIIMIFGGLFIMIFEKMNSEGLL